MKRYLELKANAKHHVSTDTNRFFETLDANFKLLSDIDKEAKAAGSYVGRYFAVPAADGYAYYQIVGETKTTFKYEVCTDLGDDWYDRILGWDGSISKKKIIPLITFRDKMNELFGAK